MISRYILQQMRQEFPTIMARVHYKVLKKKWSNLLQQYKELKNPVHGDRNKADDISWPFYSAIDEVIVETKGTTTPCNEVYIDPHEFLCVSVKPEEATSDALPPESNPEIGSERGQSFLSAPRLHEASIEINRVPRTHEPLREISKGHAKRKRELRSGAISRLPRATDLSIEKVTSPAVCSKDLSRIARSGVVYSTRNKGQAGTTRNEDEERPRKSRRSRDSCHESHESRIDRRIDQIFEYTKRRDEENRSIMMRILKTVETIANKL